jgi:hypothetical protein
LHFHPLKQFGLSNESAHRRTDTDAALWRNVQNPVRRNGYGHVVLYNVCRSNARRGYLTLGKYHSGTFG